MFRKNTKRYFRSRIVSRFFFETSQLKRKSSRKASFDANEKINVTTDCGKKKHLRATEERREKQGEHPGSCIRKKFKLKDRWKDVNRGQSVWRMR